MLCTLTERTLREGTADDFRRAWEPARDHPDFISAFHLRSLHDTNRVITFEFFAGSNDLDARLTDDPSWQALVRDRDAAVRTFVVSTGVDDVFEVLDNPDPGTRPGRGVRAVSVVDSST